VASCRRSQNPRHLPSYRFHLSITSLPTATFSIRQLGGWRRTGRTSLHHGRRLAMNRLKRAAILSFLARDLRTKGSWCGETHLQKAVYVLKDMLEVPVPYDFILYKHGPFSFDLRAELTSFRADGIFALQLQPPPYCPKLVTTPGADR